MLLISSALSALGLKINNFETYKSKSIEINKKYETKPFLLPKWLVGSDQKMITDHGWGPSTYPTCWHGQEFKPTKETLTAVLICMYWWGETPNPVEITVSIREQLNGSDLTVKTRKFETPYDLAPWSKWFMFDFEDITVIPEKSYFLVCITNGDKNDDPPQWLTDINNPYESGFAWRSKNQGKSWYILEYTYHDHPKLDFCFVTYWKTPPKNRESNILFHNLFSCFTNLFPILRILLQRLG